MALPAGILRDPLMIGLAVRAVGRHWRTGQRSKALFRKEYARPVFLPAHRAPQHDLAEIRLYSNRAQLPLLPIWAPPLFRSSIMTSPRPST